MPVPASQHRHLPLFLPHPSPLLLIIILPLLLFATLCCALDQQIDPPIPCDNTQDCILLSNKTGNAVCQNGYCACTFGTEIKNCSSIEMTRQSHRGAAPFIFRGCRLDHDCRLLNHSFCNTTTRGCMCKPGYFLSILTKTCLQKADSIDFPCLDDLQCLAFTANMSCQSGQCNCLPGWHYLGYTCYRSIALESACTHHEECAHIDGALCLDKGVCNCSAETVIDKDKRTCLRAASEIFDNCTEDSQCSITFENALCVDRKCRCRERYHFERKMNQCFIDRGLGEACGNTFECYQAKSKDEKGNATEKAVRCVRNVCTCADNFIHVNDKCVNEGSRSVESLSLLFLGTILGILFSREN